ncbi:MAG TPA: STAS domain-containing protein [Roseiflexaceae bacterium]|nr:STAS domain-containing protein [Roseiflexaceae bacterium]
MWRHLNLRARILIGYGIVLALAGGLALFLMARIDDLNRQIAAINTRSAADAEIGASLAADVTTAQQAVDRWLQDPRDVTKAEATAVLDQFTDEITQVKSRLTSAAAQQRVSELASYFATYRSTVVAMGMRLEHQNQLRRTLHTSLFQASSLANDYAGTLFFRRSASKFSVVQLFQAQDSLQMATILIDRLVVDQDPAISHEVQQELRNARFMLQRHLEKDPDEKMLQGAVRELSTAITTTKLLEHNIKTVAILRSQSLTWRSRQLKESADAIAADALGALTTATTELEQEVRRTQQLAGLALLATAGLALLAGISLARSLSRPIVDLAGAVERVNAGDYDAAVDQRAGGEIGRLAAAFNQMTATLRRQRDEVRAQQAATAERNRELEQALAELQAATAAREELASTVRAMSVPVVPILRNVIVVPLVGEIDEGRAQVLIQRLLAGVSEEQARIVILDITGVPFVDAALAGLLLQAAAAVELLGARCLLVGISPEVAQALVMSGADLSRLRTYADLRAGVEYAMRAVRA